MTKPPDAKLANSDAQGRKHSPVALATGMSSDTRLGSVARAPEVVLVACVVVAVVLALAQSIHEVRVPYQIDAGEGVVLEGAVQVAHAKPLYPRADQFPYPMRVYGPLAYAFVAIPVKFAGVNFLWPRLLVMLCAFSSALCITALLRNWTESWRVGFIFGAGYAVLPITRPWLYVLRVDFIGLIFTLAGLLIFTRSPRRWPWSVLLFGGAIFCKLSLVAAPVAVFVCMLAQNWRRALMFFLSLAGLCAGLFAVLQVRTHGWFAFHMFGTHADRYLLKQFVLLGALVVVSAPILFLFAVRHVIGELARRRVSLSTLYVPATLLTSLSAGKLGATTNHFLELLAAVSIAGGLGYYEMKRCNHRYYVLLTFGLAAALLLAAILQSRPRTWPDSDLAQCADAYHYIASLPGQRILSENVGALLLTGKPALIADPFPYTQLVQNADWPDNQLIALIGTHHFDAIVLGGDPVSLALREDRPWPATVLRAIDQHYRVSKRFVCRRASVIMQPATDEGH